MNGVKVRSTLNGRRKVIDAANIDKDNVLNRLSISECSSFVYHVTNECCKGYTLSKTLEQIQVSNEVEDINMEVDHTDSMPPSKMKRWELSDYFKKVKRNVKSSILSNWQWQSQHSILVTAFMCKRDW